MSMDYLKKILTEIKRYHQASRLLEFDQNTLCPRKGREEAGETLVALRSLIFKAGHEERFISALNDLYENRDSLSERDRRLIDGLHREYARTKALSPKKEEENKRIKNHAYLKWLSSREQHSSRETISLLKRISGSGKGIRKDFLYRKVTDEQQNSQSSF